MRKVILTVLGMMVLVITACGGPPQAVNESALPKPALDSASEKRCGDGVCDGPESTVSCPQDCKSETPDGEESMPVAEASEGVYWVENPTSGAQLYVGALEPANWNGKPAPTLVLIPGGSGDSSHFTEKPENMLRYQEVGYALVVFDPDGRGNSEGVEDNNGFTHQDGLAAVIAYAAELPMVDGDNMAMVSFSYGITMASGALARHPDLQIKFLIDWEGPATRDDTGGCDADNLGHLQSYGCDNEDFWHEREAASFALKLRVPYQRLQSESDHVQPDNEHALLMMNNATDGQYGGHGMSPWTRMNDLQANQLFDYNSQPIYLPNDMAISGDALIVMLADELFEMWGR